MKKSEKNEKQAAYGMLLSYQEAARSLGVTKTDVRALAADGKLRRITVGGRELITAQSISRMLGFDPFGCAAPERGRYTELTFERYAVQTLNHGVKRAHSRTLDNYRGALAIAARELGERRIAEIDEADLRRAFRALEGRYAASSLQAAYSATRSLLRGAFEAGDIPRDPTLRWDLPRAAKPRRDEARRVYDDAEIAEILRTSRAYNRELYTMLAVLECTGMRPGELLALEWRSYDREARTLRVYQAVTRRFGAIRRLDRAGKSKSVLSVPKSDYSVRTLRLSDTAVEALEEWRAALRGGKGARARSRFIFPGAKGRFRSLSGAEKLLQQYRAACGMPGVTFYKFRHTMCTRLALDRQPIAVIQRVLGDNSAAMINRVYTHIGDDDALRAMEKYFSDNPRRAAVGD